MFKTILTLAVCLIGINSFAQGVIRGNVTDENNSQPIPFAKVKVEGQNVGANTDFDGEYSIKIAPGSYTLIFSMSGEGYIDKKENVVVNGDGIIVLDVILGKSKEVQNLTEMKAVAQKTEGAKTVAADDARRRDEQGATEGVTDEQMKERGVTTAVEAVQMAPGLSVEDGKSVYVRGLGDRYTKTILNGMEIPGLDPDRNSVQMDIFPAAVIDNITVYKTFIPKFAGDFTGGLVDITTKDFPAERTFYVKAGLGYNTEATFNKDYISYQGGALDFLGFDDGTRALPVRETDKFPDPVLGDPVLENRTRAFSDIMAAEKSSNFLDQNYAIAYGDRFQRDKKGKKKLTYGYNVVLNYRNTHRYYDSVQFNEYRKDPDLTETKMFRDRSSVGSLAENNVMWTALIGQSVKIKRSKISLSLFHTQNGMSSASMLRQENSESNPAILVKQSLQYTQRSVSNLNLNGRHFLDTLGKWKLDWKLSPTYSMIKDPDIRSTVLEELDFPGPDGEVIYGLTQSVGAEIRRIYRNLNEYNLSGRFDLTYSFNQWDSLKSELSFGALNTYKNRNFEVYDYVFNVENPDGFSEDPDWYFQEENIWTAESDSGTYAIGERQLANSFVASQNVTGAYIMNELPLTKSFKATYGVRAEKVLNRYTGQNNLGSTKYDNKVVLDEFSILPSVNLVYKFEKKKDSSHYARYTNIRGAYASTVARPSFKEKSISQIYDPIQGRRYNGNIDLKQTTVHNVDLRWEYFYGRTELISASVFYKRFIDPIEVVANVAAPNEVQPVNSGVADLYGAELELRKSIGFNKKNKEHLHFVAGANFTYVLSQIDMNKVKTVVGGIEYTEKELRELNAREGETISNYRPMYGQSPYIINAFLTFRNDSLGLSMNLSYNVQGKKLAVIGVGSLPDVYEQPFHSLNFKVSKSLGKEQRWKASLTAKNLLLNAKRRYYESYGTESQIYDYFYQGMNITGSVSYLLTGKKKKK